jgi:hypothetical protein
VCRRRIGNAWGGGLRRGGLVRSRCVWSVIRRMNGVGSGRGELPLFRIELSRDGDLVWPSWSGLSSRGTLSGAGSGLDCVG